MSSHKHALPLPQAGDSKSTFAVQAKAMPRVEGLPAGFLTAPDSDGNCVLEVIESRYAELFGASIPDDANHLWGIDDALQAFTDMEPMAQATLRQNGAYTRAENLGPFWLGHRLGDALGNGNYKAIFILPNAFVFTGYRPAGDGQPEAKAVSLADLPAIVALWTVSNYPRKPIVGQPFTPFEESAAEKA